MKITRKDLERLGPSGLAELDNVLDQLLARRAAGISPWLCNRPGCDGSPHPDDPAYPGFHARPNQRPPAGTWARWVLCAGRGFGKTRTGAEWAIGKARTQERGALVAPTAADARDTMVEGESGILACAPPTFRPVYEPSKRRLTYPNGAIQTLYSAAEPDRLRGPQQHYAWADELAAWKNMQYAWDMLQMGLRLGDRPQTAVTTTPRPLPLVKELVRSPRSVITRGTTYDNLHNLAETFRETVLDRYEGTTLGQQELYAEILDDLPGAWLKRSLIEQHRVTDPADVPELLLRVVAMDPAGTGLGDETGLIAGGWGSDGCTYLTHDWSEGLPPDAAARRAWAMFDQTEADVLVFEDNFGKGWVREVLERVWRESHPGPGNPPLAEIHASAGKQLRAQPTAMRYEQGRVRHVGVLDKYEDQATSWMSEEADQRTKSPDRVDAAVHLDTFLVKRFIKSSVGMTSPQRRAAARQAARAAAGRA